MHKLSNDVLYKTHHKKQLNLLKGLKCMKGYENSKIPRLFEIMEQRGIKAKEICTATGVSSGLMSSYKTGVAIPSGDRLKAIAAFLDVSADYLLGNDDKDTDPLTDRITFAAERLTEDQKQDVLKYIEFIAQKK